MAIFSSLNIWENWQENYPGLELIDIAAKLQQKARECNQAWLVWLWGTEGNGIFVTRQETEKMSNITTYPTHQQCLHGAWGIQSTHFLMDEIILAWREAWPNEGYLQGHMGPWKSVKGIQ